MEEGGDSTPAAASGSLLQFKRGLNDNASPRSPFSPESPGCDSIDLAIDDAIADKSIEELYHNIYEMKSSGQSSPSMCSFTTYGTSRIDSELCHLVGGPDEDQGEAAEMIKHEEEVEAAEMIKDEEEVEAEPEAEVVLKDEQQQVLENQTEEKDDSKAYDSASSAAAATPLSKEDKVSETGKFPAKARREQPNRAMSFPSKRDSVVPKLREQMHKGRTNSKPPITKDRGHRSLRKPKDKNLKFQFAEDDPVEMQYNNHDLGSYLLKKAKDIISSSTDNSKELPTELVMRAKKSFENCVYEKPNLDYVLCLHILASIYCSSAKYEEAIPLLQKSIDIPADEMGRDHALAKFAGLMQLGDVYAVLGQIENSIDLYKSGLEIQRATLGEKDARFGETCRYVAEAHVQALRFDEAEKLCQMALDTHEEKASSSTSIEEAADRRLMGLIYDSKGDHTAALEQYALASMAISTLGQDLDTAAINCNVGDAYLALARYDEAACSYEKALEVFKQRKGENHPCVASVFVRLAELYNKVGKLRKSKLHCEKALKIYNKSPPGVPIKDIACGLIDLASIFESMNELDRAIQLLQRALEIYKIQEGSDQENSSMIAGIEAQMGVIHYTLGNYDGSYSSLKSAALKLQSRGESSAPYGIALNQMGLACVQRGAITEASELFKEAKGILENDFGPCHPDTLGVYSNLAATYDALGRWDEAIEILDFVVSLREEKLGTANAIVHDEKKRLAELLSEAGRVRPKKSRSLVTLLDKYPRMAAKDDF